YMTALKDVSNVIVGVSAILTALSIYWDTGSLWKGLGAGMIDLALAALATAAATAVFSLLIGYASPVLVSVFVVLSVAYITSWIKATIIDILILAGGITNIRFAKCTTRELLVNYGKI
ncbi:hypothetical protein ACHHRT_13790, partial [Desulfurivibrio sp. D14AmB]|uniref:hypothetical protein n=1 Tax=Desulfurivibrio sp. D14AmB TaxID=3374370 RepID=UPI00376F0DA1